ncbi:MAG: RAMP superfamily CRISPR-associated protein, partial [Candidatus Poribacteria bacterium]|nr:RAMP superfamily CRISPR-associated protein [Candidatus Poribacteria bacterium]
MMNYVLEIALKSPLTSAAGEGRVGLVDRDVAFDEMGLPILTGRRLKGLWREGYRDIADAWQQCGQTPTPVDQIFGIPGQGPDSGSASIYVANAELKEAPSLKEWLQYLQHHKIQKLHADDVVHHYANVRAQTSINRCTGSAAENTLRLTRTLKSNLVFYAPVRFVDAPNQALINALALGAVALQHMGTARTRGLGKVKCRLLELKQNGQPCDLTPNLNQNALPSISISGASQSTHNSIGQPIAGSHSSFGTPTHILRYRLTLTTAAVIPGSDGDPNTIVTRQDIPGSHLWGAAAWHYLNQGKHTPADNAFRHAFLDGRLRFLAAYPEAIDTQPLRLIPIPHSIRRFKDTEGVVDFAEVECIYENTATKRLDRRYAKISSGLLETQDIKTERNYHHARVSKNRRVGRALGAKVPDGGAFFTYEAIQAGQSFQGAVLGLEGDLTNLKTWLRGLKTVSIGRSRSAQYGEAEFEWTDEVPLELNGLVEWEGFNTQQTDPNANGALTITTLSPLSTVNDNGHP